MEEAEKRWVTFANVGHSLKVLDSLNLGRGRLSATESNLNEVQKKEQLKNKVRFLKLRSARATISV